MKLNCTITSNLNFVSGLVIKLILQISDFRDSRIFVLIKLIGTIFVANVAAFMV